MESLERERAERASAERTRYFHDDAAAPNDRRAPPLWRSWRRCQAAGLEPRFRPEFATIGRSRILAVEERSRKLIAAAHDEMRQLAGVVGHSGLVAMLADETGVIVRTVGDTATHSHRLRLAARQGVDLSELAAGTNAVGTALFERTPISIVAQEHYFESNSELTCVAVPLFGPTGGLIGALDLSGDHDPRRPDCLDFLKTFAAAIENRLLRALPDMIVLAFSAREELLGTPCEGLLLCDPAGRLTAANGRARSLLGLAELEGMPFENVFDRARAAEIAGHPGSPQRTLSLTSQNGFHFAARIERPSAAASRPSPIRSERAVAREDANRAATLRLIDIVTGDKATAKAFSDAQRALARGVPVLLGGETGTGKELFARALHDTGERSARVFMAVNCAALPESLIEGELFGDADGAYTGARRGGAPGRIEAADGGTLFLDEIGDMPLVLQTRLLRILQERTVVRLGESRERPIDISLLCASNRGLPDLIARGLFRQDLYYRINGLCVTLPPLRERSNVLDIAAFFLARRGRPGHAVSLSEAARKLVLRHSWPGNLRELDHAMTVATAFLDEGQDVLQPEHFPVDFRQPEREAPPVKSTGKIPETLDEAALDLIEQTVLRFGGNVSAAARALKISRSTIYSHWKRTLVG